MLVGRLGVARAVDRGGLEQPEVAVAAGHVRGGGVQERAEDRRAQDRLPLAHRVLHLDDVAQRAVARDAQTVEQRAVGEAPARDLVEPAADEDVLRAPPDPLGRGQHADRALARGQRRGEVLVDAVQARDLLDEVRLAGDVLAAPVRHRDVEPVAGLRHAEAERTQVLGLLRARDRDAEQPLDARLAQPQHRGLRSGAADVDRARQEPRARELDEQRGGDRLRVHRPLGREALLVAGAGLGAQAELVRGRVDRRPVPVGDLEQHARRRLGDLRAVAAHDPGDRRGALVVGDEAVGGAERADLVVERDDLLALRGRGARRGARLRRGRGRTRAAAARSGASRSS